MPFYKMGARQSNLSRAQVEEVKKEWDLHCEMVWVATTGDIDQKTSLRGLEKTDFFTKELDQMVLQGQIDAAIHSAKDLPEPLPKGLKLAALSKGIDPRDSLVFRMPLKRVATSSERREKGVKEVFPFCECVDIRGCIEERLAKWESGEVDGVVIAHAALIRLQLTHLPYMFLPGPVAPLQGKIALVCRENEEIIFGA